MNSLAELRIEEVGDVVVATLEGEVDASNAARIGAGIRNAVSNEATSLVADLTETSYLDSAGLNLFFELRTELSRRQQSLRIVVDSSSPVARTISITGLSTAVPLFETREAALAD